MYFVTKLRLVILIFTVLFTSACNHISPDEAVSAVTSPAPRSVSTLLHTTDLRVYLRVLVNGIQLYDREVIANGAIPVTVPLNALTGTVNQVSILFYIPAYGDTLDELPLATSQQVLSMSTDGSEVPLSGRQYQYADSDNDGVFNVHELSVEPRDLDGDTIDNVFDSDSDGDANDDGIDDLPYEGSNTNSSVIDLQQTLVLEYNESLIYIAVEQLLGDTAELLHAANSSQRLSLRSPDFWPATPDVTELSNKRWTAYGLKAGSRELCPDWTQSVGASSIQSSVKKTVLLYFRRDDGSPFVAALNEDDIADLDIFENDAAGNSRGPFNDGLRMVLVQSGTVGWLDVYTDKNFEGRVCSLNITSDQPAMNILQD